jgi:hypothetical protein
MGLNKIYGYYVGPEGGMTVESFAGPGAGFSIGGSLTLGSWVGYNNAVEKKPLWMGADFGGGIGLGINRIGGIKIPSAAIYTTETTLDHRQYPSPIGVEYRTGNKRVTHRVISEFKE